MEVSDVAKCLSFKIASVDIYLRVTNDSFLLKPHR